MLSLSFSVIWISKYIHLPRLTSTHNLHVTGIIYCTFVQLDNGWTKRHYKRTMAAVNKFLLKSYKMFLYLDLKWLWSQREDLQRVQNWPSFTLISIESWLLTDSLEIVTETSTEHLSNLSEYIHLIEHLTSCIIPMHLMSKRNFSRWQFYVSPHKIHINSNHDLLFMIGLGFCGCGWQRGEKEVSTKTKGRDVSWALSSVALFIFWTESLTYSDF